MREAGSEFNPFLENTTLSERLLARRPNFPGRGLAGPWSGCAIAAFGARLRDWVG